LNAASAYSWRAVSKNQPHARPKTIEEQERSANKDGTHTGKAAGLSQARERWGI